MKRRPAVLVVVAVGIAGCGSSQATPASYRTTVNKLCAANNAKLRSLPATANNLAGGQLELKIASDTLAAIKRVPPPSSLSSGVHAWLGDIEQERTLLTQALSELKAGQTSQLSALVPRAQALQTQGNAAASRLGLPSCAQNASPGG